MSSLAYKHSSYLKGKLCKTLNIDVPKHKSISGSKIFVKPWDKTSKNIFFDYNQFEKIPQNDEFAAESQSEFA